MHVNWETNPLVYSKYSTLFLNKKLYLLRNYILLWRYCLFFSSLKCYIVQAKQLYHYFPIFFINWFNSNSTLIICSSASLKTNFSMLSKWETKSVDKNDTKINVNLDCCHKWLLAFAKMLGCYRVFHSNLASYYINNPLGVLEAY